MTDLILLVFDLLTRQNTYSSSLLTSSQIYRRDCDERSYYYESIQVKVHKSGDYSFRSYSTIDTYGSIYKNTFNPLNPTENLFQTVDDTCSDFQFGLDIHLTGDMIYLLVITTSELQETGPFSIIVLGDNKVTLKRLSEHTHACIVS